MHWNYNECCAILIFEDSRAKWGEALPRPPYKCSDARVFISADEIRQKGQKMANYNHVKVLKQGVTVWNRWRQNHPEIIPDLSRTNLRSAGCLGMSDLSGANLREVDLCGTYLFGIILTHADLSGANLREADLSRVNLEGANLTDADLRGADLEGANLKNVQLAGANLEKANLACAQVTIELRNAHSIEGTILPDRLFYPKSCYSTYWRRDFREIDENWEKLVRSSVVTAS